MIARGRRQARAATSGDGGHYHMSDSVDTGGLDWLLAGREISGSGGGGGSGGA